MGKQVKKKTKLELKSELKEHYQAWKVIGVAGYVNDSREQLAKDLIESIATHYNFIPSYFATIVLTEGLGWAYLGLNSNFEATPPYNVRNDKIVSGYQAAGTDDFGSEYSRYKKYLPASFNEGASRSDLLTGAEFIKKEEINERGKKTISAEFSNMESMIWAFGATLSHRRDLFEKKRKELGFKQPTEDEIAYWTYIYYQGEGDAKRMMNAASSLAIFGRNGCYPNCKVTARNRTSNDVALSNLASWRYLQTFNIFSK